MTLRNEKPYWYSFWTCKTQYASWQLQIDHIFWQIVDCNWNHDSKIKIMNNIPLILLICVYVQLLCSTKKKSSDKLKTSQDWSHEQTYHIVYLFNENNILWITTKDENLGNWKICMFQFSTENKKSGWNRWKLQLNQPQLSNGTYESRVLIISKRAAFSFRFDELLVFSFTRKK